MAKMKNIPAHKTSAFLKNNRQINVVRAMPNPADLNSSRAGNKPVMLALTFALTIALGLVVMVIGTSIVEASSLPTFTVANALSAKQDNGIASVATVSVTLIAFAALALVSKKS